MRDKVDEFRSWISNEIYEEQARQEDFEKSMRECLSKGNPQNWDFTKVHELSKLRCDSMGRSFALREAQIKLNEILQK